jgi:peroxiredoxin
MSLNTRMKAFQHAFEAGAPPGVLGALHRAAMALRQSDILERALKAGEPMPGFTLPDTRGRAVALAGLLRHGPVVVSFYRGDWCDYCAMELAALSAIHDHVKDLGATLVGISPQAPEARIGCDAPEPPFPLLFDAGAKVARRCRIAFTLSDELRQIYAGAGRRPPPDGRDNWLLPLPATYVVDRTGEVAFSYVDTDYTSRLEPADIITVLAHLADRMDRERPHRVRRGASKGAALGSPSCENWLPRSD